MVKRKRPSKKDKNILVVGKRKAAVARAVIKKGTGKVMINRKPLDTYTIKYTKLMIMEPFMILGDVAKQYDISVNVSGGGVVGQASAIRQAIAKAFVKVNSKLKEKFMEYDQSLLIADPRRNEPHKPSRSKKGPRKHKQRSKR